MKTERTWLSFMFWLMLCKCRQHWRGGGQRTASLWLLYESHLFLGQKKKKKRKNIVTCPYCPKEITTPRGLKKESNRWFNIGYLIICLTCFFLNIISQRGSQLGCNYWASRYNDTHVLVSMVTEKEENLHRKKIRQSAQQLLFRNTKG